MSDVDLRSEARRTERYKRTLERWSKEVVDPADRDPVHIKQWPLDAHEQRVHALTAKVLGLRFPTGWDGEVTVKTGAQRQVSPWLTGAVFLCSGMLWNAIAYVMLTFFEVLNGALPWNWTIAALTMPRGVLLGFLTGLLIKKVFLHGTDEEIRVQFNGTVLLVLQDDKEESVPLLKLFQENASLNAQVIADRVEDALKAREGKRRAAIEVRRKREQKKEQATDAVVERLAVDMEMENLWSEWREAERDALRRIEQELSSIQKMDVTSR